MSSWDAIILGAGAAGLLSAIEAARRGRRVLVIDHAAAAGEKIRISGGGRCNFTNIHTAPDRFLSENPRFAASALARFTPADITARITAAGISWHEKTLGQLFCDGSARAVVAFLLRDLTEAGGTLWLSTLPGDIERGADQFRIPTPRGIVSAPSVVVATGGKSIPKMGATGYGYAQAQRFGLRIVETRPGLVPLTFAHQDLAWLAPLAGLSLPARVTAGAQGFDEALLFTHRGLSGPAILQASSYWREGAAVTVGFRPDIAWPAHLRAAKAGQGRQRLAAALAGALPDRLANVLADRLGGARATQPLAEWSGAALDGLASDLAGWTLRPVGTEGYRTAEVTLGGVATDALDARTLAARAVPGLHFVGEVVDVTGWLGGYNFQWAWASGWAAGQVI